MSLAHREREVSSARTQQHFKNSCKIQHKYHGPVVQAPGITPIFGGGKAAGCNAHCTAFKPLGKPDVARKQNLQGCGFTDI